MDTTPSTTPTSPTSNININKYTHRYDRFNEAKLKILSAILLLNKDGLIANSVRISNITKKPMIEVANALYHYSVRLPYLKKKFDHNKTDGCYWQYFLAKEGKSVLPKLQRRKALGLDLNLRHPEH